MIIRWWPTQPSDYIIWNAWNIHCTLTIVVYRLVLANICHLIRTEIDLREVIPWPRSDGIAIWLMWIVENRKQNTSRKQLLYWYVDFSLVTWWEWKSVPVPPLPSLPFSGLFLQPNVSFTTGQVKIWILFVKLQDSISKIWKISIPGAIEKS